MRKILVLEDNVESLTALEAMIAELSEEFLEEITVLAADNLLKAREFLREEREISLFLLDINLNEKNATDMAGMEFAREVRAIYEYELVPIVFITSILSMELTSYREIQCYQYITKPFEKKAVQEIIRRLLKHNKTEEKEFLLIKKDGINYKIACDDIILIQAVPRGIRILLKKEELKVRYLTLKQLLPKLSTKSFLQCHRMCIINRKHIEYVDFVNRMIKMLGTKEAVEIGGTYKARVKEWIHE